MEQKSEFLLTIVTEPTYTPHLRLEAGDDWLQMSIYLTAKTPNETKIQLFSRAYLLADSLGFPTPRAAHESQREFISAIWQRVSSTQRLQSHGHGVSGPGSLDVGSNGVGTAEPLAVQAGNAYSKPPTFAEPARVVDVETNSEHFNPYLVSRAGYEEVDLLGSGIRNPHGAGASAMAHATHPVGGLNGSIADDLPKHSGPGTAVVAPVPIRNDIGAGTVPQPIDSVSTTAWRRTAAPEEAKAVKLAPCSHKDDLHAQTVLRSVLTNGAAPNFSSNRPADIGKCHNHIRSVAVLPSASAYTLETIRTRVATLLDEHRARNGNRF